MLGEMLARLREVFDGTMTLQPVKDIWGSGKTENRHPYGDLIFAKTQSSSTLLGPVRWVYIEDQPRIVAVSEFSSSF
jgi:hypothetical protein